MTNYNLDSCLGVMVTITMSKNTTSGEELCPETTARGDGWFSLVWQPTRETLPERNTTDSTYVPT